jgi:peptidoglycan/LPS O-acetylase OafA/YrhL
MRLKGIDSKKTAMNHKIINIQFLRAFAALIVIFYHTAPHYYITGGEHSGNIFSFFSQIGYAGVDIFFVISGYIMWYSSHNHKGTKDVLEFIYARFTRIYPVYWSFFFLLIIMYWGGGET